MFVHAAECCGTKTLHYAVQKSVQMYITYDDYSQPASKLFFIDVGGYGSDGYSDGWNQGGGGWRGPGGPGAGPGGWNQGGGYGGEGYGELSYMLER